MVKIIKTISQLILYNSALFYVFGSQLTHTKPHQTHINPHY